MKYHSSSGRLLTLFECPADAELIAHAIPHVSQVVLGEVPICGVRPKHESGRPRLKPLIQITQSLKYAKPSKESKKHIKKKNRPDPKILGTKLGSVSCT